jgi:hypothetical protein
MYNFLHGIYKTFSALSVFLESLGYYIFINRDKFFVLFLFIYFGVFCIEVLCYNYLLNYVACMNGPTDSVTSTFIAKNGTAKVVTCESIAHMIKHVSTSDSVVVQVPIGKGEIVGSNVYAQPVRQYSKVGHHLLDISKTPWYVRVSSYVFPPINTCSRVEGVVYTHI